VAADWGELIAGVTSAEDALRRGTRVPAAEAGRAQGRACLPGLAS
jgi:hypothetical protein